MRSFKVNNIHCSGCANRIKNAFEDEFSDIEINLNVEPKIVSLNIKDEQIQKFKDDLNDLGFEFIEEVK